MSTPGENTPPLGPPAPPAPPPVPASGSPRFASGFSTVRDLITFVAGLAVIFNEVFLSTQVEPVVLGVGIALMGLPLALQADERRTPK